MLFCEKKILFGLPVMIFEQGQHEALSLIEKVLVGGPEGVWVLGFLSRGWMLEKETLGSRLHQSMLKKACFLGVSG